MEAVALEQTLREHPDDPAAWLVYGDWLLEHDDPRGALIQLEHRRASARAEDRAALQAEIDALVKRHRPQWEAALPEGVRVRAWRHGFATEIAVRWSEDAPAQIERALREPFVRGLRLFVRDPDKPGGPDDGGDDEDDVEMDDDGIPILPDLSGVSWLAALDLRRISSLDLSYTRLGAGGAAALAASETLGGLEVLALPYCNLGDRGVEALAAAPRLAGVRRLRLQRNGLTAAGAAALRRFERLTELDLRYNAIGAEGAQALLDAPFAGSLARLDLLPRDLTDAGVTALASSSRLAPALRSYWRGARRSP